LIIFVFVETAHQKGHIKTFLIPYENSFIKVFIIFSQKFVLI